MRNCNEVRALSPACPRPEPKPPELPRTPEKTLLHYETPPTPQRERTDKVRLFGYALAGAWFFAIMSMGVASDTGPDIPVLNRVSITIAAIVIECILVTRAKGNHFPWIVFLLISLGLLTMMWVRMS
jgi:hypothetical protein